MDLRLLMKKGVYYTNAHYQHANTETIVGHSTLATGTFPSQHGMIGNVWLDREARELAYNIEDPDHPIIATREDEPRAKQVDPAQRIAHPGPVACRDSCTDIGRRAGGLLRRPSKVFGVSGKTAVPCHGRTYREGLLVSTNTGDFVTSTYYYDAYPGLG